ncbi:alpha-L-iduronidase-like [Procambarus clarkii]|uniref:alpha-L-iduronidase-like n=1 Tax=Procambarus clarkii TaxID=6728 RepID=UPI00374269DB
MTYKLGMGIREPYHVWLDLGRPVEPTRDQLAYMRSWEGPRRTGPRKVVSGTPELSFRMKLSLPDVRVIHVCQAFTSTPGQVTNLRTIAVTSSDVLITWSDQRLVTRCVLMYEVEHSRCGRAGPYIRLKTNHINHNNLWYSLPHLHGGWTVQGWYRVRVVTYWGARGPFSPPVFHHLG